MRRRHRAGDDRPVGVVAELHDAFLLVFLPLEEGLVGAVHVEAWIVGLGDQFLDVFALVFDRIVGILAGVLAGYAVLNVGEHLLLGGGQLDAVEDDVARPPGLGVEHVEGEPLVLHAEIEQRRIVDVGDALVEVGGRQPVGRPQAQVVGQEREVVLVAGAQDDRIDALGRAVLEGGGVDVDSLQQRPFFPIVGPFEAHRRGAVAVGDRLCAVLPALRADVLGRVAGADDQDVLAGEFAGVAEVMGVQDAAVETVEAGEFRHVRGREMARGDDDVVEFLGIAVILRQVLHGNGELLGVFVPGHHAHGGFEADPLAHAGLVHAAFDVVEENRARRIGGDLLAEMLFEGIVGELQALLGAVRPEIAVHRAVDGLAILVEAGAPRVVPQAAPVGLLFEADNFRDIGALRRGGLKCSQLCEP